MPRTYFRGIQAPASLKLYMRRRYFYLNPYFRGIQALASLKPQLAAHLGVGEVGHFRGIQAPASLKLSLIGYRKFIVASFPGHSSPGLIEAPQAASHISLKVPSFPGHSSPGLIEATRIFSACGRGC